MGLKETKIKAEQGVSVRTGAPGCRSECSAPVRVDVWVEGELESLSLSATCSLSVEIKAALILRHLEGPNPIWALLRCWDSSATEVPFFSFFFQPHFQTSPEGKLRSLSLRWFHCAGWGFAPVPQRDAHRWVRWLFSWKRRPGRGVLTK